MAAALDTPLDLIVARHGKAVLADRSRLTGLLRDHAPDELAAIRALIEALDQGVPARLGPQGPAADPAALARESETLAAGAGCRPDLARQAVETWAGILARSSAPPPPMPLPLRPGSGPAAQALSGTVQPLPGAQAPLVEPLSGLAGLPPPAAGTAAIGLAGTARPLPSRSSSRLVLAGLVVVAIVVAAIWILRIVAT